MNFDITQVPRRATREHTLYVDRTSQEVARPLPQRVVVKHRRILVPAICWMGVFAVVYLIITVLVVPWGYNLYNNVTYGNPRTSQIDAVVGHSDSSAYPSHFIALNLHGHVEVIEFAGGNPGKATVYVGPIVNDASIPVTLTFSDQNGDGKLDMVVNLGGSLIIYYNTGKTFVLAHV